MNFTDIYIYIYTEMGTILKKYIIDKIKITYFFLIIDITTIIKKIFSRYNYKYRIFLTDTS